MIHRCDHQIFGVVASAEMPGEMVRKILCDSCPLRTANSGCWCLARLHFEDIPAEIQQLHCSGWCVCLCLCSLVDGLKTEKKVLNYVTVDLICFHCFAAWQQWCECERLSVRGHVWHCPIFFYFLFFASARGYFKRHTFSLTLLSSYLGFCLSILWYAGDWRISAYVAIGTQWYLWCSRWRCASAWCDGNQNL